MFSTPSPWSKSAAETNSDTRQLGADLPIPITGSQRNPSACNFIHCDTNNGHSLAGDPNEFPSAQPQIHISERARLACQACRRDNKKCDNNRPCARCLTRAESCVHVEKAARTTKRRCQACRSCHLKCEDSRPCQQCVKSGTDCFDVSTKGDNHRIKVKKACTQCRRSKIQCDEERPCRNCNRRNLKCDSIHYPEGNFDGVSDEAYGHVAGLRNRLEVSGICAPSGGPQPFFDVKMEGGNASRNMNVYRIHGQVAPATGEGPSLFSTARNPGSHWSFQKTDIDACSPTSLVLDPDPSAHNYPIPLDYLQQGGFDGISDGVHSYNNDECRRNEPSLHPDGAGPVLMPVMPVPNRYPLTTYSTRLPVSYPDQSQGFRRSVNHYRDPTMPENFF